MRTGFFNGDCGFEQLFAAFDRAGPADDGWVAVPDKMTPDGDKGIFGIELARSRVYRVLRWGTNL